MVALGQVWPLRPRYLFHCRQSNGHQLRLGCWAHSTVLGWQAPRAVAILTTRAVLPIPPPPPGGLGVLLQELFPTVVLDPGLGEGVPSL